MSDSKSKPKSTKSSASVEEFDTATAIRAINSKLMATGDGSGSGSGSGGGESASRPPLTTDSDAKAEAVRFVGTIRHLCKTEDATTESFTNLVWSITSSQSAALSPLVFELFALGTTGGGLPCVVEGLTHSNWMIRRAMLPLVRALALSDVMFCRALAESTPVLHSLHLMLTASAGGAPPTSGGGSNTAAAAAAVADAVTAHYISDILSLLIPAHPKRVCTELITANSLFAAAATNKTKSSADSAVLPLPLPLVPLLCRCLCESASLSSADALPPLGFRQTTQTFILRALFFVVESVGLELALLSAPNVSGSGGSGSSGGGGGGGALTYLTHYILVLGQRSSSATSAGSDSGDLTSLITALSLVRIVQSLVSDPSQAERFTASYSARFLTRCIEWSYDTEMPDTVLPAITTGAGSGGSSSTGSGSGSGSGTGSGSTPLSAAANSRVKVSTDPAISSLATAIATVTAEWRAAAATANAENLTKSKVNVHPIPSHASGSGESANSAGGAGAADTKSIPAADIDLGTESHANIWRVACQNCRVVATEENLPKFARCGKCRLVTYCSGECQRADWTTPRTTGSDRRTHKEKCFANQILTSAAAAVGGTATSKK